MSRVVLLDDECELREEITAFLEKRGWFVSQADTLALFYQIALQADIAIIDVMLPDGSGIDAANWLRKQNNTCGIVILTARGEMQNKVNGLQSGADHYLVKPVDLRELDAILVSLGRRVVSKWRVDPQIGVLLSPQGMRMELSSNESALLALLAQHPLQPVSRRAIAEYFGYDWLNYDERRLETAISRLRRRWRDLAGMELPLKTVHGLGYNFTEPLILI